MEDDPPYLAEYAKSNRAMCRDCSSLIAKDSLRIAIMVQSRHFDGKQPHWYHYSCFFVKCRPGSIDDIKHFHNLRWPDQEKIRAQVERSGAVAGRKGGKSTASAKLVTKSLQDFVIQYAVSNRSTCKKCEEKIEKDEIRISHKEIDPLKPHVGLIDRWHHVGCFVKERKILGWDDDRFTADMLTNFKSLDAVDKKTIRKLLDKKKKKEKATTKETSAKVSSSNGACAENAQHDELSKQLKEQSKLLWKMIDNLQKLDMKKPELVAILEENDQVVPKGIDKIYDRIADGMLFGKLPPCTSCGDGQLVASSRGFYRCTGNISGWTSCNFTTRNIKRTPWIIPEELKDDIPFLKKYKFKPKERVFPSSPSWKPLKDKCIATIGKLSKTKDEVKSVVEKLGGSLTTSLTKAYCCISTKHEVDSGKKRIKDAEVQDIFIVSEDFLDECEKLEAATSLLPLLKKFSIASWGSERKDIGGSKSMKRSMAEVKSIGKSKKMKVLVKSGSAVDPESNKENSATVFERDGKKYTATLSLVDMKSGANSYYKLQLLVEESGRSWHVFRSWGRVGTNIGGTKLETFYQCDSAIQNFLEIYYDKTGNEFGCSDFQKIPRKFYPVEIDYSDEQTKLKSWENAGLTSTLPPPVQELMKAIFDIENMKKTLIEFEIDLEKMPLGKLSKRQMQKAYAVLTEVTELMNKEELDDAKILDCSNRFYTLIPHDYGFQQPPLLDNEEIIKTKVDMLDNLMDIEVAYKLLEIKAEEKTDSEDPVDVSYKKLNCVIEPVGKESDEFKMVQRYAELTHACTHDQYTLSIEELFKIERKGEAARFRPFHALQNRKLLWHGSRSSNYAGILSQGLRIAPPEAPVTGYMFGKGLYFADMVSKSANYCGTSSVNPVGLCLLADVALGNTYELTNAKSIRKLPKGKHSVMGIGATNPDPSSYIQTADGVTVPMGAGVQNDLTKYNDYTSLLYNEYIVYDVAQVNLKYLVKFRFNYKALW